MDSHFININNNNNNNDDDNNNSNNNNMSLELVTNENEVLL